MQNIWLRSGIVTILSILFCWVFYIILDVNVLDYLSTQDNEADVINYYYKIENRKSDNEPYTCFYEDNVVIFDLEGSKSRYEIAEAIKNINKCNPHAIVLDVIFPRSSTTDSVSDRHLEEIVSSSPNIYTACRIAGNNIERSFYSENGNIKEGLVNRTSYKNVYEIFNCDTYYYMPFAVMGEKGENDPLRLVNYRDKEFYHITINDSITHDDVEGRIVIVGDLGDLRDTHDMPFNIDGKQRIAGTMLMAHTMSTIINNSWIIKLNTLWGMIIAVVFTFFFSLFCYWMRTAQNKTGKAKIDPRWESVLESFLRIAFVIILLLGGYSLFARCNIILNLVYTMLSIALTGIAINIVELFDWWKEKSEKK